MSYFPVRETTDKLFEKQKEYEDLKRSNPGSWLFTIGFFGSIAGIAIPPILIFTIPLAVYGWISSEKHDKQLEKAKDEFEALKMHHDYMLIAEEQEAIYRRGMR